MAQILALWRLLAFVIFTALMFFLLLLTRLFVFAAPAAWRSGRNRIFRIWARVVVRLVGMRVKVLGPLPRPPFLLVVNHLGYIDIVLLAATLDAVFVAKAEVSRWPFFGTVVRSMNTIFIERGARRDLVRANLDIASTLRSGEGVIVFAEGTSSDGTNVLPLKPSMLQAAVTEGMPVHCAHLSYITPVGSPEATEAICWWDDTPLLMHMLRLFRLPYFDALVHFSAQSIEGHDRKQLASGLHARIMALSAISGHDSNV